MIVWSDELEARWQKFITDFRARSKALDANCPACLDRKVVKVFVEGEKPCPWCASA